MKEEEIRKYIDAGYPNDFALLNLLKEKALNEWQLCPKCNGSGEVSPVQDYPYTAISTLPITCNLCNGKKIISKITGNPPK